MQHGNLSLACIRNKKKGNEEVHNVGAFWMSKIPCNAGNK
jgi:hypothetical protein